MGGAAAAPDTVVRQLYDKRYTSRPLHARVALRCAPCLAAVQAFDWRGAVALCHCERWMWRSRSASVWT